MSFPCHHEIIVSQSGLHMFTTAPIHDAAKAKQVYDKLKEVFPESKGFKVSAWDWKCEGREAFKEERTLKPIQARTLPPVHAFPRDDGDYTPIEPDKS